MEKEHKPYGFIFWLHALIDLIFVFSFMFFSWYIILIGVILLQLQFWLLKGCILAKAEFGEDEPCIPFYLHKWGIVKNKKKIKVFIRYYLPFIVLAISLIWQLFLGFSPLII